MREDLVLLAASNTLNNRGIIDKKLHGYATIQFVCNIRGGLYLSYDEEKYDLQSGSWFFPAHPGPHLRFHAQTAGGCWHHRHIGFSGPLVEKWRGAGIWLEKPQRVSPNESENYAARMDELIEWVRAGDKLSRWRAINGLEGLLLQLVAAQAQTQQASENEWLNAVLERLDGSEPPSLALLARDLGLSDTALRRRFKAATGQTMQEWLLTRKISAARALLSDSELPLRVIAAQLGYRNEYFFSRQFKTMAGVAPGAFRKSRLRG